MRPAAAAALLATLLAGCQAPAPAEVGLSHVHGLAYDPGAGALLVATHHGLARGVPEGRGWAWSLVGDRHDFMGFTQDAVQPGTFYSSGHPDDPRAFGGPHLGLRRSTDGGLTWEQRSLKGQVDFHALASLPSGVGHLAGAWQGNVKLSRDGGATWADHPAPGMAIHALAASNGTLWAGTSAGLRRTPDLASWQEGSGGRFTATVSSLAVSADGRFIVLSTGDGRSGGSHRSLDGGASWEPLSAPALRAAAAPVLFALDPQDPRHLFASTVGAQVLESRDQGATWTTLRA